MSEIWKFAEKDVLLRYRTSKGCPKEGAEIIPSYLMQLILP